MSVSEGLASLEGAPAGVSEATALIAGFDDALRVGFGRLGADQVRAIDALARAFTGTPLEARVTEAAAAIRRSEFLDRHLGALAAARAALQGAMHDALSAQASKALGREPSVGAPAVDPDAVATASAHEVLLEGVRAWLLEVALAGFSQVTPEAVLPFGATLEKLQEEPALARIGALLTGFQDEILATLPIADDASNLPLYRWGDLWSRAFVLAQRTPAPLAVTAVSGTFVPLGTDLRQHDMYISAVIHGVLLDPKGPARHVRATLASYKVDVVFSGEAWGPLAAQARRLCTALSSGASLEIKDMRCTGAGDLLWSDDKAKANDKNSAELATVAPKALAPGAGLLRGAPAGADRHPLQVGELVWLSDVTLGEHGPEGAREKAFVSGGVAVPIATERMSDAKDFGLEECEGAKGIAGLLRHDRGRWAVQPLSVVRQSGKKTAVLVSGALGAEAGIEGPPKKGAALPILRERASKLLRKKS